MDNEIQLLITISTSILTAILAYVAGYYQDKRHVKQDLARFKSEYKMNYIMNTYNRIYQESSKLMELVNKLSNIKTEEEYIDIESDFKHQISIVKELVDTYPVTENVFLRSKLNDFLNECNSVSTHIMCSFSNQNVRNDSESHRLNAGGLLNEIRDCLSKSIHNLFKVIN